jgi:hypothetical protein
MRRIIAFAVLSVSAFVAHAFVPPSYSGNVNNAVGSIVQKKLTTYGLSASDPAVAATLQAISAGATTVAVGAATGAIATVGWPALLVSAGVAGVVGAGVNLGVDGLIKWLWPADQPGKVAVTGTGVVAFGAMDAGGAGYFSNGNPGLGIFASPEEAAGAYAVSNLAMTRVLNLSYTESAIGIGGTVPTLYFTIVGTHYTGTTLTRYEHVRYAEAPISCAAGYKAVNDSCVSTGLTNANMPSTPATWITPAEAVAVLPEAQKTVKLSDEQLAILVNALWQNINPTGNVQPQTAPLEVTPADIAQWRTSYPGVQPTVGDFTSPVAAPGQTSVPIPMPSVGTDPGTNPDPDPDPDPGTGSGGIGGTSINWGTFTHPALEETPTVASILDPIFNTWPEWKNFSFPPHSSECPTPQFEALGATFTFDHMCVWVERIRPGLEAAFAVMWAVIVIFIVMGA